VLLAEIARGGGYDRSLANRDLLSVPDRLAHVLFAHEFRRAFGG
jgi:hypothetical protein